MHILELLDSLGLSYKQAGQYYKMCCPFHTENIPSLIIYPETNSFCCFGCDIKGDMIEFVRNYFGYSYKDALDFLGIDNTTINLNDLKNQLNNIYEDDNIFMYYHLINKLIYKTRGYHNCRNIDIAYKTRDILALKKYLNYFKNSA